MLGGLASVAHAGRADGEFHHLPIDAIGLRSAVWLRAGLRRLDTDGAARGMSLGGAGWLGQPVPVQVDVCDSAALVSCNVPARANRHHCSTGYLPITALSAMSLFSSMTRNVSSDKLLPMYSTFQLHASLAA